MSETASTAKGHAPGQHPDLPPPVSTVGVVGWLRTNLFSSWFNAILTMAALWLLYIVIPPLANWIFLDADWAGDSREDCSRVGACWVFIKVWFKQLMYGRYPNVELWRINTAYLLLLAAGILLFVPRFPWKQWVGVFLLFIYPVIAFQLFVGGDISFSVFNLLLLGAVVLGVVLRLRPGAQSQPWVATFNRVFPFALAIIVLWWLFAPSLGVVTIASFEFIETPLWGGLFLTLVIAVVGIVASLPIGIVLALGRRSKMPIIKAICVAFIELWRGVPLITVLFMASVMFPLFMPEGVNFDKLLRALIGVMLFSAAYMAEVVRGGLQAIPKGQYEAAEAIGLSYWKMMGLVVLPQALKMVIPGIVNTFIGLFKDTTLVLIIGLFDFLGMAQLAGTNPDWLGFAVEGYVFTAFGFWIFCFGMSRYSQHLERKLHTGH
ncbi:MAG TPA: amino acid ABC transporter permease [Pseudomonadales bacterium]